MIITHISWHFPSIFLLCENSMNDISYRHRDVMRKPELQWLRPFRPAWTCSWAMPPRMAGPWQAGSTLVPSPECPLTTEERWWPLRAASAPAAILTVVSVKGFIGICVLQRLLSGWEQPGFPLLPAFLLLGMQETSPHDLGHSTESNNGVSQTEVFLCLIWPLQEHCLLYTTCLLSPEDQGGMLDKNMLKWYLFLPSPKQPSGSHQSWRCDASGTRSWLIIWGRIAKLSTGLTISIIR